MPGPVFLRGETVELRTIESEDAEFLAELLDDPEVRAGLGRDRPISVASEREWIESLDEHNPDGLNLLICADGDPVGTIGLMDVTQRWGTGELGYMVAPEAQNEGYATDAVAAIIQHVFDELRLEKVEAKVYAGNEASARVLEKVGFEREGRKREHVFVDGERIDLLVFGLLAREFDRAQAD